MSVDNVLDFLDRGIQRTGELSMPVDPAKCWRCQVRPPGEGSSGVCWWCRTILLAETPAPVLDAETAALVWEAAMEVFREVVRIIVEAIVEAWRAIQPVVAALAAAFAEVEAAEAH